GLLVDGEALRVAVLDEGVLPGDETFVQVGAVLIGLADRVAEDAVRVYLVGEVLPAVDDRLRSICEHAVDLLAAEVLRLLAEELLGLEIRGRGGEAAALQEDRDALLAVVQPPQESGCELRVLA